MLRPATPLSILFFVAFCLLLLSTLSTPIIKAIPLATYRGIDFGVLGYCRDGVCNGPMIGYNTGTLLPEDGAETDKSPQLTMTQRSSSAPTRTPTSRCPHARDMPCLPSSSYIPSQRS
jgi:hypothetical protein